MHFGTSSPQQMIDMGNNRLIWPNGAIDMSITAWVYLGRDGGNGIGHASTNKTIFSNNGCCSSDNGYDLCYTKPCCGASHRLQWQVGVSSGTQYTILNNTFQIHDEGCCSNDVDNARGWIFVCGTYCAGTTTMALYERGGNTDTTTDTSAPSSQYNYDRSCGYSVLCGDGPNIGSRGIGHSPFSGLIDDARFYRKALSANEVEAIFQNTRDGSYGDLARPARKLFHFSGTPNLAPTAVALSNVVHNLAEDADVSSATKIADIVVTDDGEGTNTLSLSGTDSASFQIVGTELRLKQGIALNAGTKRRYAVTVVVDDTEVGSTPDLTVSHTLKIIRVPPVESDLVADSSGEDDVLSEIISANLRGGLNRMTVYSGGVSFTSIGTRSEGRDTHQFAIKKFTNKFDAAAGDDGKMG
jgi:hypothetical protein